MWYKSLLRTFSIQRPYFSKLHPSSQTTLYTETPTMHIYEPEMPNIDVPQVDLLTYLFGTWSGASPKAARTCQSLIMTLTSSDHPSTRSTESTIIHAEAANPSNAITKGQARILVQRLAYTLRHDLGVGASGPGKDVVLCTSSGNPFIPILFYAIVAAGGIFSAASTAATPDELSRQVQSGGAKVLVCSAEYVNKTVTTAKECHIPLSKVFVLDFSKPSQWCLRNIQHRSRAYPSNPASPRLLWQTITSPAALQKTTICILYSSGTTGLPKGVSLSHGNCVAACTTYINCGAQYISQNLTRNPTGTFEFRTVAHLPVAHIAGLQICVIQPFALGGTTYWMPKFEFDLFLKYVKDCRTTVLFTVPPVWLAVANSPAVTDHFDTLEVAVTGAAPMGPELQQRVSAKLGRGRTFVGQTWGATETCGSITGQRWDIADKTGSVGSLIAHMRARILDDEDRDVQVGEPGEICLKGPAVTQGYWANEEATKAAFVDGWYRSGDVGFWRDGKIYIVDRKKELIKYKGLQVAPAELEALLISHPKILDAAVIGVQSVQWETEVPRAYVVPKPDEMPSEEEVKAFVKKSLSSYKQLRGGVYFVEELPKTPSGKILRKDLRKRIEEEDGRKSKL